MSAARSTIYEALKAKLGREPTHNELVADVRRILSSATTAREAADAAKAARNTRRAKRTT